MLQAKALTKKYGEKIALKNLNISIDKGEIYCLLGQNGAGKTTTINLFLGFIEATSGEAIINGEQITPRNVRFRKFISYIPEVVQLYGNLTGLENLDFFTRLAGYKYSREILSYHLAKAGLQKEVHAARLSTYSKGMRQKTGIAIALAKKAQVILMDEPTSGLDPKAAADFIKICKMMCDEGKTIFMTTHDIFNAVNVAARIGIMRQGELIHTINSSEITANELQQLYLETI